MKDDTFTSSIEFAIEKTLETLGDSQDERIIREGLKRSAKMWESIRIHGLQICGMTYEQYCEQLENKRNVIFLSDDEMCDYIKAKKIMNILGAEGE